MKRLRIFAGPNGSGKSSLYKQLQGTFNLGTYLNADDLFQAVSSTSMLDLNDYGIVCQPSEWSRFWDLHGLKDKAPALRRSRIEHNILVFGDKIHSYEAAILSDFLRHQLLRTKETFSFETVFSHASKLDFMKRAGDAGYKCYLYFSAVSSPEISVSRVRQRVMEGGHDVPEDRIRDRYYRTLDHLKEALSFTHRAYLFDNSTNMKLVAELDPQRNLDLRTEQVPLWLQTYVLNKLTGH